LRCYLINLTGENYENHEEPIRISVGGMGPRNFYAYTYNQKHLLFSIHPMEIKYGASNVAYVAQTTSARANPYPD
jgi:hypothetical protein